MTTQLMSAAKEQRDVASRQVPTFGVGGETYGVDILRVHEILASS
jgi:chemotaxis signal transduction protein